MTDVELYVDPTCPWAWVASRWLTEVAPARGLSLSWRSYCVEIRDDFEVPAYVPEELRPLVAEGRAMAHRLLRVFEVARTAVGEDAVRALYDAWGQRCFSGSFDSRERWLAECAEQAGVCALLDAADDPTWDKAITDSMQVAYGFAGDKSQTPVLVVRGEQPFGFKGPVMATPPTGEDAVRLWDALTVVGGQPGFFELTRPRTAQPGLLPPM